MMENRPSAKILRLFNSFGSIRRNIPPATNHDTKCCGFSLSKRFAALSNGPGIDKDPPTFSFLVKSVTYTIYPVEDAVSPLDIWREGFPYADFTAVILISATD